jgi:hypothetical protein
MLGLARFGSPVRGLVIRSLGDVARDQDRARFSPAVLPLAISISANDSPTLTGCLPCGSAFSHQERLVQTLCPRTGRTCGADRLPSDPDRSQTAAGTNL